MTALVKHDNQKERVARFRELATVAIRSGCYGTMTVESAINVMMSADDLGVAPFKALNGGFHVIKGKITMAGHLISDRIRAAGHSVKVVEHTREKCVIIGVRTDTVGDSYKSEFDIEDAKLAGLLASDNWKKYPRDMLYNRAIARLGRILFSDVVGACYSEDEKFDIQNIDPAQRPVQDPDEMLTAIEVHPKEKPLNIGTPLETLQEHLVVEGIDISGLQNYIYDLSINKEQSVDQIIESALLPPILPKFKECYLNWVLKRSQTSDTVTV